MTASSGERPAASGAASDADINEPIFADGPIIKDGRGAYLAQCRNAKIATILALRADQADRRSQSLLALIREALLDLGTTASIIAGPSNRRGIRDYDRRSREWRDRIEAAAMGVDRGVDLGSTPIPRVQIRNPLTGDWHVQDTLTGREVEVRRDGPAEGVPVVESDQEVGHDRG